MNRPDTPAAWPNDEDILKLWEKSGGKAWEPRGGTHGKHAELLIATGFVERCDMRCGFEAFKDTGLRWTEAGKIAAHALLLARKEDGQ